MDIPRKWRSSDDSDYEEESKPFDFDLAGASTPLKTIPSLKAPEVSTIFLSPINKLNKLNLNTSPVRSADELELLRDGLAEGLAEGLADDAGDERVNDGDDDEDDESGYSEAEKTILSDGSVDFSEKDDDDDDIIISLAIYINSKKRGMDSPLDMVLTPRVGYGSRQRFVPTTGKSDNMSICEVSTENVSVSQLKMSFSNSDSTPCPRQSRKRLKFKETTPSSTPLVAKRKALLDFSSSTKASISILNQLTTEHLFVEEREEDEEEDGDDKENYERGKMGLNSDFGVSIADSSTLVPNQNTPISQSTPANSRPPTPPILEEYGDSINGYKLLRETHPQTEHPYFSYETPEQNKQHSYSQIMRNSFIGGNPTPDLSQVSSTSNGVGSGSGYQIVGEFPITSAGLMNENDEDLHIGDKRINDPYLSNSSDINNSRAGTPRLRSGSKLKFQSITFESRREDIKDEYLKGGRLPLLKQFEYEYEDNQLTSKKVPKDEILELINDHKSVYEFYKFININEDNDDNNDINHIKQQENLSLLDLVKRERIKWHPDKWIGNVTIDKEVIDSLSQALNVIVDELR